MLTVHDGHKSVVTGREALDQIFDLIQDLLPAIPIDDPVRPHLARLAPVMNRELGRPTLTPVA